MNNKHNYYSKIGVYDELYKTNLKEYLLKNSKHTKYLSIDSTFIENKYASEGIGRNIYYKNKQGIKVTSIVDVKGVPLAVNVSAGNIHDCKLFGRAINELKEYENMICKKYFMADKGYDSKTIRDTLRKTNNTKTKKQ